ncbi:hypothetical protein CAMGR0001_2402 [Campylobacter gracilis RM3268]|uniref:Uncharacterized protein n=1 Tax=Campylobacter gracilis RM3268 TaxID=553220 RepID=C8PE52_9BACT|nr:hypothetical protein CAMGR0001_2402 [Campylobacter gracilis RM3268]
MAKAFRVIISFGAISAATCSALRTFCSFELVFSSADRLHQVSVCDGGV